MTEICRHCGAALPSPPDAFCPKCQTQLLEIPPDRPNDRQPVPPDEVDDYAPPAYEVPLPDRLVEFQHKLTELTPRVWVTPVLIGLNVAVFIVMVVCGVNFFSPSIPDLLYWGADSGPETIGGQWWRLLTCTFIHVGILHILFNMCGPRYSRPLRGTDARQHRLPAGVSDSRPDRQSDELVLEPAPGQRRRLGAIFGIYGVLLALLLRNRDSIPGQALTKLRNSGLGFVVYNLLYGLTLPNIDMAAHVGGLAGGFICGLALSQPLTTAAVAGRTIRNLLVTVLGIVLVAASMTAVFTRHAHTRELADAMVQHANLKQLADAMANQRNKVQHGNLEVFYGDDVTKTEADRLADYLTKLLARFPTARVYNSGKHLLATRCTWWSRRSFGKTTRG